MIIFGNMLLSCIVLLILKNILYNVFYNANNDQKGRYPMFMSNETVSLFEHYKAKILVILSYNIWLVNVVW